MLRWSAINVNIKKSNYWVSCWNCIQHRHLVHVTCFAWTQLTMCRQRRVRFLLHRSVSSRDMSHYSRFCIYHWYGWNSDSKTKCSNFRNFLPCLWDLTKTLNKLVATIMDVSNEQVPGLAGRSSACNVMRMWVQVFLLPTCSIFVQRMHKFEMDACIWFINHYSWVSKCLGCLVHSRSLLRTLSFF
jgi:hypothetical protein